MVGLFLIGIVLGEAFLRRGTVYFSAGMHAGLIAGLKSWPAIVANPAALPRWLFGFGRFPLVSGAGAWMAAIVILALIRNQQVVGSNPNGSRKNKSINQSADSF